MHISIKTGENELQQMLLVFGLTPESEQVPVPFRGPLCWMIQTKTEPLNKDLIQKSRFCCHHIDISRKLQQDIETQPPKCWQQFACAIATCWKCVLQVRKYEPASVLSLWYDPESSFHQGWNGLGSNWQKLVALGVFFLSKVRLTLRHVTGEKPAWVP